MIYNTTDSLEKLIFTDYVDFGKSQDRFGRFLWSKNDSNYLDVKVKVIKKADHREFSLVQNRTMGEANFNQFKRVRNQLVTAAKNFAREETLTPVLIPKLSKDMDKQLKLANKHKDLCDSAALHCGQAWELLCSSPNVCKEEGVREVSTSCLYEIKTWRIYLFTWCNEFSIW